MHLENFSDALLASLCRVRNSVAGVSFSGVNPDVGQATKEWVSNNLERKSRKRLVDVRLTSDSLFLVARISTLNACNVKWGWKVVQDSIQHWLNTLVLESRTTENRVSSACNCQLTNCLFDFGNSHLCAVEVLLH